MTPYRYPLFRALARQPDIDLQVWFMARTARNRRWSTADEDLGFRYEVLPSFQLGYRTRDLFSYIVNPTFPARYAASRFDVLISAGWLDFATQAGFVLSKVLRRRYITWCESTAYEPSWRRTLAQPLVTTMVRGSSACVAVGRRSKDYLASLGARERDIFTAFSTVDVAHFRTVSDQARPDRDAIKARLGIRRRLVILYVGQFIQRKGLVYLLDAYARAKSRIPDLALVLLGYGPMRDELMRRAAQQSLSDVHFLEHVEVGEIPQMYAMADLFVLPSLEETWGLVVNEAMACRLPVVVTDRVGSSDDLVHDGTNGFVVAAANSFALADRIEQVMLNDGLRQQLGEGSARLIERFTAEGAAEGFAAAVRHAMGGTTPESSGL